MKHRQAAKGAFCGAVNHLFLALLFLSLAAALYTGLAFHAPARKVREVELLVRFSDVEILASRAGISLEEALVFLREHGVTSIGVAEYTLWRLRRDEFSYVLSSLELAGELALNPAHAVYRPFLEEKVKEAGLSFGDYVVFMPEGSWSAQVWEHLQQLALVEQPERFRLRRYTREGLDLFIIQGASYENLTALSLGAKPAQLEHVQRAGLFINPYLSQRRIESPATAEQMLSTFDGYPLSAAVFEGGTVPGYPLYLPEMAAALEKRGLPAVVYEYHRFPRGLKEMAPLTGYNLLVMRPGSINDPPEVALNGIRERRVQMLELNLRDLAFAIRGEALLKSLAGRLELLTSALKEAGYHPGKAAPLMPRQFPPFLYLLMAAGLLSLFLLLLQLFWSCPSSLWLFLLLTGMACISLLFRWNILLTQQALALAAAVLFPLYCALLLYFFPGEKAQEITLHQRRGLPGSILSRLSLVFLLALAGGVLLHGFLTAPPFFHGVEMFRGVKAMYILPMAAAGLLAFTLQGFHESGAQDASLADLSPRPPRPLFPLRLTAGEQRSFFAFLRRLLRRPLTLGDLLLAGVLLAAAFIYITRTGHVVEINPLEDLLRHTLEKLLGVRPRFKEFLLGYPAAAAGLYLSAVSGKRALRRLAFFLLFIAALAPVSVVNTFAHITAPLTLSFLRSLHGFWLGCLGGLILTLLVKSALRLYKQP